MHHEAPRKLPKTLRKLSKLPRGCKTLQEISGRSGNFREAQEFPGKLERVSRWYHHCVGSRSHLAQALLSSTFPASPPAAMSMPSQDDKDWLDGDVEAAPVTSSGLPIVWQVYTDTIHGTKNWADFKPHECLRMESALVENQATVTLQMKAHTWTINLTEMVQVNNETGTKRPIRRTVIIKQCVITD